MTRWTIALTFIILLLAGLTLVSPMAGATTDPGHTSLTQSRNPPASTSLEAAAVDQFENDRVVVKFTPGISEQAINQIVADHGLSFERLLSGLDVYVLRSEPGQVDTALQSLAVDPAVAWSEPNYRVTGALHPTDPDYNDPAKVYVPQLVGAEAAWDITIGSPGVTVAVLDSGISWNHPEFAGRIVPGKNMLTNTSDIDMPYATMDDNGHGTHVSGIIAAAINNGLGTVGIAPTVKIMPVKVLDSGNGGTSVDVASGLIYAADQGIPIANLSLVMTTYSHVLEDAVSYAADRDVLIVTASGNMGGEIPAYPAMFDRTFSVDATDRNDQLWPASNYNNWVDISAPGVDIWSSYWTPADPATYTSLTGTSMATAHVSGLAALLLSLRPDLTTNSLRTVIERTAMDLGAPGWDPYFGHGRIDVGAAVKVLNSLYVLRANSGNGDYVDSIRLTWDKEQKWNNVWGFTGGGNKSSNKPVSNTDDDALYQSWHEDPKEYRFVVPNGTYQVILRFAEFDVDKPGERVMRISIEDTAADTNLDIFAAVGRYAALDRTYRVVVTDGQLNIGFARSGGSKNPAVSAIEVMSDLLATTPKPALRRVVSWDHDYQDSNRLPWDREQKWSGSWGFTNGGRKSSDKPVSGTADATLYQHWHDDPRQYRFPLPSGTYQVTLRFAEFETGKVGERVMQIAIEGNVVEPALDVYATVGRYVALDRVYQVTVTDGELNIGFTQLANKHPMVSSIEVLPQL